MRLGDLVTAILECNTSLKSIHIRLLTFPCSESKVKRLLKSNKWLAMVRERLVTEDDAAEVCGCVSRVRNEHTLKMMCKALQTA
jgi:hypothetical protein